MLTVLNSVPQDSTTRFISLHCISYPFLWKIINQAMEQKIRWSVNNLRLFIGSRKKNKGKAVPLQAWTGPEGSRKLRLPDFVTTTQDGDRLSALRTGRLYSKEILISIRDWVDPRAIVRSERFYINEKSTDTSWDRTSDLPICSTTP